MFIPLESKPRKQYYKLLLNKPYYNECAGDQQASRPGFERGKRQEEKNVLERWFDLRPIERCLVPHTGCTVDGGPTS